MRSENKGQWAQHRVDKREMKREEGENLGYVSSRDQEGSLVSGVLEETPFALNKK